MLYYFILCLIGGITYIVWNMQQYTFISFIFDAVTYISWCKYFSKKQFSLNEKNYFVNRNITKTSFISKHFKFSIFYSTNQPSIISSNKQFWSIQNVYNQNQRELKSTTRWRMKKHEQIKPYTLEYAINLGIQIKLHLYIFNAGTYTN